jgi:hypothetical protein
MVVPGGLLQNRVHVNAVLPPTRSSAVPPEPDLAERQERNDGVMWVAIRDWMLADQEPPLPSIGSVLRSAGVRVSGTVTVAEPDAPDSIATTLDSSPQFVEYALTGVTGLARDVDIDAGGPRRRSGAEFVLTVSGFRFQVRFDGSARDVLAASRVVVRGQLSLVADYEWEAFQLADSRADWRVRDVVALDTGGVMVDLDYEVDG